MIKVPKIFHFIWVGPKAMPKEFADNMVGWSDLHPGWEVRLWTDRDLYPGHPGGLTVNPPHRLQGELYPLTNQVCYDRAIEGAAKCDILCLELLYRFGGVYLDCDMEPRKNIEPIIDDLDLFAATEGSDWVSGGIMGATEGHPAFKALINRLPQSINDHADEPLNHRSGPVFRTPIFNQFPMTVFPAAWFYPYLWYEKHRADEDYPQAYAIHRWAGSWKNV